VAGVTGLEPATSCV